MEKYTIAIRTLGTAGEKFDALMRSIAALDSPPEEVLIVLPEGYSLPNTLVENARVIRSQKGMVAQRTIAIDEIQTPYLMLLDDDLEFEPDFTDRLYEQLKRYDADFCSPKLVTPYTQQTNTQTVTPPQQSRKLNNLLRWCIGVSWFETMEDGFILKVANTGGFIMNAKPDAPEPMYCQSGYGAIVFGKTSKCKAIHFEDELWVENTTYALMDDQIFYYKAHLQGNKIVYAPDVELIHLDAGTSITGDKKLKNIFASACNTLIFHHRFVLHNPSMACPRLAMARRIAVTLTVSLLQGLKSRNFSKFTTYCKGYIQGFKTIKSKEYKALPVFHHRAK